MTQEELHAIFTDIPALETERLSLRRILPRDAIDMYAYSSDENVTRHLLWDPHPDPGYTAQYIEYLQTRYAVGDFFDWALIWKEDGRMIGTCGFTNIDLPNNNAEIGYVLHPDFHRRGIAAEAAKEVIRFGFSVLGLHRISAVCMKENTPSMRVMEKCGMTQEAVLRQAVFVKGTYRDVCIASVLSTT